MDHQLKTWKFIAAETITIADIALYPYTAWAEEAGVSLEAYPAIRRWLGQVEAEQGFLPLMRDGAAELLSYENYFDA
jgi:glutathione S-transferase